MSDAKNILDALVAGMEHAAERIKEIERIDEMDREAAEADAKQNAPPTYHYVPAAPGWFLVSKDGCERMPIVAWRIADFGDFCANPEAIALNHGIKVDMVENLIVTPEGKCYDSHELAVYENQEEWQRRAK